MPKKVLTAWEIAKPVLEQDYLAGRVKDWWPRGRVHKARKIFEAVPINNFGNNWNRMKAGTIRLKNVAKRDEEAMKVARTLHPIDYSNRWDGSDAQRLLAEDINDEFHLHFTPKELWLSREEYQKFELEKFAPHVSQEIRSKLETTYWLNKKWKKEQAKKKNDAFDPDNLELFVDHENDYGSDGFEDEI